MATRRSRLQIRPNIGPKPGTGRGCSSSTGPKFDRKPKIETKKPDVQDEQKTAEQDSPEKVTENTATDVVVKKTDVVKKAEQADVEAVVADAPPAVEELPSVKSKATTDESKSDVKPKFRSRFPKAKPNIANIGRPDKRTTTPLKLEKSLKDASAKKERVVDEAPSSEKLHKSENEKVAVDKVTTVVVSAKDEVDSRTKTEPKPSEKSDKPVFEKPSAPALRNKKLHSKKKRNLPSIDAPPDRSTMKMIDLIYWNPSSNLMKRRTLKEKVVEALTVKGPKSEAAVPATAEPRNKPVDDPHPEKVKDSGDGDDDDDSALPVPQVKIGPDGNIILNEASLVVDNKSMDEPIMEGDAVEEDESTVNYKSFRERRPKTSWSDCETAMFYKALSTVGTDFSLMLNLFPKRTRREIKNKFKKEERYNRIEIDKAIKTRTAFRMADFEAVQEEFRKEVEAREQAKKDKKKSKKPRRGKKRKENGDEIKENKKARPKRKKRRLTEEFVEDTDEDEMDDIESNGSRVDEVVEILMEMREGKLGSGANIHDQDSSGVESDTPSEAPSETPSEALSVASNSSAFVPRHIKVGRKRRTKTGNIEEDVTVDNVVANPGGDIGDLVASAQGRPEENADGYTAALARQGSRTVPTVSVTTDGRTSVPTSVENMEVPEGLLPLINTAGGADNVQIVLVQDVDAESGQTLVHVYILPKTAEQFSMNGTVVHLVPTKDGQDGSGQTAAVHPQDSSSRPVENDKCKDVKSEPSTSSNSCVLPVTPEKLNVLTAEEKLNVLPSLNEKLSVSPNHKKIFVLSATPTKLSVSTTDEKLNMSPTTQEKLTVSPFLPSRQSESSTTHEKPTSG